MKRSRKNIKKNISSLLTFPQSKWFGPLYIKKKIPITQNLIIVSFHYPLDTGPWMKPQLPALKHGPTFINPLLTVYPLRANPLCLGNYFHTLYKKTTCSSFTLTEATHLPKLVELVVKTVFSVPQKRLACNTFAEQITEWVKLHKTFFLIHYKSLILDRKFLKRW